MFITGRRDTQEKVTYGNLVAQGYIPYDGYIVLLLTLCSKNGPAPTLILRPPQFYDSTAEQYKSYYRQQVRPCLLIITPYSLQLAQEGANIIGCIGDQVSDCNNGYAGYIMKIPYEPSPVLNCSSHVLSGTTCTTSNKSVYRVGGK